MKIASITMAALCLTSVASADFTGLSGTFSDDGTYRVVQLYANYDDSSNITLSVFNANTSQAFFQNDGGGGMFLPFFTGLGGDPSIDSYVNFNNSGTAPNTSFNSVQIDPNFGTGMGQTIPTNAGWFWSPTLPVMQGSMIHLGQFVLDDGAYFEIDLTVGWKEDGGETFTTQDSYATPAPGALALLALGGLATRRRRA